MAPYSLIELCACQFRISFARSGHFLQDMWMATYGALSEDHHAACQDIGAFYSDTDRYLLIRRSEIVVRPKTNPLATMDVHPVIYYLPAAFRTMVFHNCRNH